MTRNEIDHNFDHNFSTEKIVFCAKFEFVVIYLTFRDTHFEQNQFLVKSIKVKVKRKQRGLKKIIYSVCYIGNLLRKQQSAV